MNTERDPRWLAIAARDRAADGRFYYSVKTTGVYCRPSCAARRPKPENVAFHATAADAERAGFRPCKRCKPDLAQPGEAAAAVIAAVCRLIEGSSKRLALADLARHAGLSPSRFHRVFKAATGLTPAGYADARRAERVRHSLAAGSPVTEAIYGAGYESGSRFYEKSDGALGMTPSNFRAGGRGESIRFAVGECSLGSILVAQSGRGICAILLGADPDALVRELQDQFPRAELTGGDAAFETLVAVVAAFVEEPARGLDLPLDIRGAVFQRRVWQALREVPPGATASYSEIARRIGAPGSARAVANACAANPLAVAIPCHRVVRNDGGEGGYRWGVERKRALLANEAAPRALTPGSSPRSRPRSGTSTDTAATRPESSHASRTPYGPA